LEAEDMPDTHNNETFQIVQSSKSRKKSPLKRNYATRGNTGLSKILK